MAPEQLIEGSPIEIGPHMKRSKYNTKAKIWLSDARLSTSAWVLGYTRPLAVGGAR